MIFYNFVIWLNIIDTHFCNNVQYSIKEGSLRKWSFSYPMYKEKVSNYSSNRSKDNFLKIIPKVLLFSDCTACFCQTAYNIRKGFYQRHASPLTLKFPMKREHTRPYSYTTCTPLCLSKFHADRNGTQYEQIVSFEVSFREVGRGKGEGKGEEALSPGFRCNSLQSDIVKYRPMRVSRMLNSYTRKHTHTQMQCTRESSSIFPTACDSPHETHANPFLRFTDRVSHSVISSFSTPLLSSPFFSLSPSLSLSLSLLYRRLHAMPLHVLCPLFRIIAANKMVRCGCRWSHLNWRMDRFLYAAESLPRIFSSFFFFHQNHFQIGHDL